MTDTELARIAKGGHELTLEAPEDAPDTLLRTCSCGGLAIPPDATETEIIRSFMEHIQAAGKKIRIERAAAFADCVYLRPDNFDVVRAQQVRTWRGDGSSWRAIARSSPTRTGTSTPTATSCSAWNCAAWPPHSSARTPTPSPGTEAMPKPIRITEATLRVLIALEECTPPERAYGLWISKKAELPSGTIYPILDRLERAGWIRGQWETVSHRDRHGRPPRRYYELTAGGHGGLRRARAVQTAKASVLRPQAQRQLPETR